MLGKRLISAHTGNRGCIAPALELTPSNAKMLPDRQSWRARSKPPRKNARQQPRFIAPQLDLGEGHHDIIGLTAKELAAIGVPVERRRLATDSPALANAAHDCDATHFFTYNFTGLPNGPIPPSLQVVSWQWDMALRLFVQRPWLLDILPRDAILPCTMKPDADYLAALGFQNAFWLPAGVSPDTFRPLPDVSKSRGLTYPLWNRFGAGLESLITRFPSVAHFEQWLAPIEMGGRTAAIALAEKLIGSHPGPLSPLTALACLLWVSARDLTRWRRIASLEPFDLTIITPLPRRLWPSFARRAKRIRHVQGTVPHPDGCNRIYNASPVVPFPGECMPGPSYWNPRLFEAAAAGSCQCAMLNPEDLTDPAGLVAAFDLEHELPAARSLDAWHATIDHLLAHPAAARELGAAAQNRVLGQHTIRRRVEQLMAALGSTEHAP